MSGIHMALLGALGDPATIFLDNHFVYDFTGGARDATAGYRLTSTGLTQTLVNITYTTQETWCTPTAQAVNYEAYVSVSGSTPAGTIGSWVALSTTQEWALQASIGQNLTSVLDVQVRRVGTTAPVYTATISLNADASF